MDCLEAEQLPKLQEILSEEQVQLLLLIWKANKIRRLAAEQEAASKRAESAETNRSDARVTVTERGSA
jgi:hypothetical protein